MRHIKEFSRFAKSYDTYNVIQDKVAKELLEMLPFKAKSIVDLGCGSGTLYKNISWELEHYKAIDLSDAMLSQHPQDDLVEVYSADFDSQELFSSLKASDYDLLLSSSSLQWSKNLKELFKRLSQLEKPLALSLFTSKTFFTLHQTAQTVSPLYSFKEIQALALKYFHIDIIAKSYKLKFEDTRSMFTYLKKSGVSGVNKQLGFKETKELMKTYPLDYLEFEVVFITVNL